MRYLIFALLCCAPALAHAQQYLIKYDLTNLKHNYYRINHDTSRVRTLDLKKSGRIILRVENFNPYYWNAKVTSYKNPVEDQSGYANAFNPLGILSSGFGDIFSNIPFLDLPKSRGPGTDANSRFLNAVSKYAQQYEKVQNLVNKHEELVLVKMQLQELKYNNLKSEGAIKSEARELVKNSLGIDSSGLMPYIRMGKQMNTELTNALDDLTSSYNQVQQPSESIDMSSRLDGKTFNEMSQQMNKSYSAISKVNQALKNDPAFLVDEVVEVGSLYRDIATANFNFIYSVNTEPDLSYLKLELFPRIDSVRKDTMVQYFEVNGKKNLKIRNSVGVAFTHFAANAQKYVINQDSTIAKENRDLFTPLVATYIHFYGGRSSGFRWGGTFGIGIPIAGEKKDVNFMLGLSTAFGQNEPILLSVGLSGAKVSKLTSGYQLGQKINHTNADRIVTSGYDLGAFVSLSFNLTNLGKK